jgi:Ca-activated chloride channel family protein
MQFINGNSSYLIVAIGLLLTAGLLLRRAQRRRRQLIADFAGSLGQRLCSNLSHSKRRWRQILLMAGLCFLALAGARPWWGRRLVHAPKRTRDVLVLLDCSRSMLARDVAPSRLQHAKWWLRQLTENSPGDRFGLIAFAGDAFLECPLTQDRNTLFLFLDDLNTDSIPIGGTNIQKALETAHAAFKGAEGGHRAIILISDGGELQGQAEKELDFFRKNNIPIFVVGIGDPDRETPIQTADNVFLRDAQGDLVTTRLNETGLRKLSTASSGIYVRSTTVTPNMQPVAQRVQGLVPETQDTTSSLRPIERYQIPLSIGVLLLLIRLALGERTDRARTVAAVSLLLLGTLAGTPDLSAEPTAANPTQGTLLQMPAANPMAEQTPSATPQMSAAQQAAQKAAQEAAAENAKRQAQLRDYIKQLREELKSAESEEAARLHYNLGTCLQTLNETKEAEEEYQQAIQQTTKHPELRSRAYQNLGVLRQEAAKEKLYQDPDASLGELKLAEGAYREALRANPKNQDPAQNMEMLVKQRQITRQVKKQMEEMAKQQQKAQQETQKALDQQKQANQEQNPAKRQQKQQDAQEQTRKAREATEQMEQSQPQAGQQQQSPSQQAGKELDQALEAQQKQLKQPDQKGADSGKEAEKHLQNALQQLQEQDKKDQSQKDGENSGEQKKDGEQGQESKQDSEKDASQAAAPSPDEDKSKEEAKGAQAGEETPQMDQTRAQGLLFKMGQDERDLRKSIKQQSQENMKLQQVEKNW